MKVKDRLSLKVAIHKNRGM